MSKNRQKNKDRFREIWRRQVSSLDDEELLAMAKDRSLELAKRKIVNNVLRDRGLLVTEVSSVPDQKAQPESFRVTWREASSVWARGMLTAVVAGAFVALVITLFLFPLTEFGGSGTPAESLGDLIEVFVGFLVSLIAVGALLIGSGYCNARDWSFKKSILSGPHAAFFHVAYVLVAAATIFFAYPYLAEDSIREPGYLFYETGRNVSRGENDNDWVYVGLNDDALKRLLSDEFEPVSMSVGLFGEQFVAEFDKHDIQGKSLLWGGKIRDYPDSELVVILDSRGSVGLAIRIGKRAFAIQGPQANGHYRATRTNPGEFGLDFEVIGEDVVLKR